jgi:hypothetical protein
LQPGNLDDCGVTVRSCASSCKMLTMTESPDDPTTITMPERVWSGIYGDVDNAVQLAAEDDDEQTVDIGSEIMEEGSRHLPGDPSSLDNDRLVSVTLTRRQWQFVLDQNRQSTPIYESLGDEESLELGRAAEAIVSQHLG